MEEPVVDKADKFNVEKKFAEEQKKKKGRKFKVGSFVQNPVVLNKTNRSHLLFHYDHNQKNYLRNELTKSMLEDNVVIRITGNSLCLMGPENCIRSKIGSIANSKVFNFAILILIVLSTLTLSLDSPLEDPDGQMITVLTYIDYAMTGVFAMEAVIKIISFGFVFNGPNSYIRSAWNVLDFIIVLAALTSIFFD